MSDIPCRVCGEPWDAYGVHHGGMLPWERDLFKAGAGCPSCEGERPEEPCVENPELAHAEAILVGAAWDDPDSFACPGVLSDTPVPAWKRPEPAVVDICHGCRVRIVIDPDDGERRCDYPPRHPDAYRQRTSSDPEDWFTISGERYCDECAQVCDGDDCAALIFRDTSMAGDIYAEGASFLDQRHSYMNPDLLCIDCYERIPSCPECGEPTDDDEPDCPDGTCESCCERGHDHAPAEPADDDYVLSSTGPLGALTLVSIVGQSKPLGTFTEETDALEAIKAHQEREQFWGAAWRLDDHGGLTLIEIP